MTGVYCAGAPHKVMETEDQLREPLGDRMKSARDVNLASLVRRGRVPRRASPAWSPPRARRDPRVLER